VARGRRVAFDGYRLGLHLDGLAGVGRIVVWAASPPRAAGRSGAARAARAAELAERARLCVRALLGRLRYDPCSSATAGEHLLLLQWLCANGCPWNGATCMYAADGGHLKVLQRLHANGCPWGAGTCGAQHRRRWAPDRAAVGMCQWLLLGLKSG
jgi:hypothetical protein